MYQISICLWHDQRQFTLTYLLSIQCARNNLFLHFHLPCTCEGQHGSSNMYSVLAWYFLLLRGDPICHLLDLSQYLILVSANQLYPPIRWIVYHLYEVSGACGCLQVNLFGVLPQLFSFSIEWSLSCTPRQSVSSLHHPLIDHNETHLRYQQKYENLTIQW